MSFAEPLNETILILFGIYVAGGFAAFFRSWFYTLAGQRLVARLRKKVCKRGFHSAKFLNSIPPYFTDIIIK